MKRVIACIVALTAVVALSGCFPGPEAVTPSTPSAPVTDTAPETETLSEPHGTWELSAGLPENTPSDLPLPTDRWIEGRSAPFTASGGMVELWVTADEVDEVIAELEHAGWTFGETTKGISVESQVAFDADQTKSLYVGFRPEDSDRDAQLTVTYTADLPG